MNKIVLVGKLIKDPELKTIEDTEKVFTRFIVAVERNFKAADGTRKADLIPITMWGRKAEVICKYMKRGSYISVSGRLKTGSYEDKFGNKKYIAEVVAEDFKFVANRNNNRENNEASIQEL